MLHLIDYSIFHCMFHVSSVPPFGVCVCACVCVSILVVPYVEFKCHGEWSLNHDSSSSEIERERENKKIVEAIDDGRQRTNFHPE